MKTLQQILLIFCLCGFIKTAGSQSDSSDLRLKILKQLNYDKSYNAYCGKLSFHSYFDIIRQAGGGIEYTPWPFIDIDARIYGIYPFSPGSRFIFYGDYFNYNGIGTSLFLKFFPNSANNGFYIGPYGSLQYMEYRNRWIAYRYDDHEVYMRQKQSKFILGKVPFTSIAIGYKKNYKHIGIDFFFGMGACFSNERLVIQERKFAFYYPGFKDPHGQVPETKQHRILIPDAVFGVKLSFGTNRKQIKTKEYYTNYFESCIYAICEKTEVQQTLIWVPKPVDSVIRNSKNYKKANKLRAYKKSFSREYIKHSADEKYLIEYVNDMIDDYIKYHPHKTGTN